ncbi:hypothetical protein KA037_04725 [Patescibacteria group bacterium]|nr:hypothetical protein [Patescibacteria group bacterium]
MGLPIALLPIPQPTKEFCVAWLFDHHTTTASVRLPVLLFPHPINMFEPNCPSIVLPEPQTITEPFEFTNILLLEPQMIDDWMLLTTLFNHQPTKL